MQILIFLGVLSLLVMIHELGHFIIAKKNGILVEEFGFGLPPRIWGKKIGETVYSINWLPIGGFVKLYGEDAVDAGGPRAFFNQKKRVRLLVLIAGVMMNFLLGVVLFGTVYSIMGVPTKTDQVRVVGVLPNSPAEQAGIKTEEIVVAIDEVKISQTEEFVEKVKAKQGQELELELTTRKVKVTPRLNPPEGQGALGIVVSNTQMKHFPWWQMPFRGAWLGMQEALGWGLTVLRGLWGLTKNFKSVAGPVGIYQLTSEAMKDGVLNLLQFVGILSVNLAVLNILPFPALDGGRLVFLGIEAIFRRRVSGKVEHIFHAAGMAILLSLMVLVTINDVLRLVRG